MAGGKAWIAEIRVSVQALTIGHFFGRLRIYTDQYRFYGPQFEIFVHIEQSRLIFFRRYYRNPN